MARALAAVASQWPVAGSLLSSTKDTRLEVHVVEEAAPRAVPGGRLNWEGMAPGDLFVPVKVAAAAGCGGELELTLRGGLVLRFGQGVDPGRLAAIVKALSLDPRGSPRGGPARLSLPSAVRIFLCTEPTDMRRGFDPLAEMVRQVIRRDPLCGRLFVFRSRVGDRLELYACKRWPRRPGRRWSCRSAAGDLPRRETDAALYFFMNSSNAPPNRARTSRRTSCCVGRQPASKRAAYFSASTSATIFRV